MGVKELLKEFCLTNLTKYTGLLCLSEIMLIKSGLHSCLQPPALVGRLNMQILYTNTSAISAL